MTFQYIKCIKFVNQKEEFLTKCQVLLENMVVFFFQEEENFELEVRFMGFVVC